ncbi:hypothetical protein ACOSQ4_019928 [Xanthoceras sorbifolium]
MWVAAGKFLLDFVGAAGVFSAGATARSAVVAIAHSDAAACVADSGAIFLPFGVAVGCPAVASVGCLAGAAVAGSSVGVLVLSDAATCVADSGAGFQPGGVAVGCPDVASAVCLAGVVVAGCPAVAAAVYIAGAVIGVPLFAAVNPAGATAYFSSPCASSATASSSSFVVVACPAAQDNRWVPPVCGSFKLNVDAAFGEACGKFRLGMVVHDSLGCLCFAAAVSCSGHISVELQKPWPSPNVTNWQLAGI